MNFFEFVFLLILAEFIYSIYALARDVIKEYSAIKQRDHEGTEQLNIDELHAKQIALQDEFGAL